MKYLLIVAGALQLVQAVAVGGMMIVKGPVDIAGIGAFFLLLSAGAVAIQVFVKQQGYVLLYLVNALLIVIYCGVMAMITMATQGGQPLGIVLIVGLLAVPIMATLGAVGMQSEARKSP